MVGLEIDDADENWYWLSIGFHGYQAWLARRFRHSVNFAFPTSLQVLSHGRSREVTEFDEAPRLGGWGVLTTDDDFARFSHLNP